MQLIIQKKKPLLLTKAKYKLEGQLGRRCKRGDLHIEMRKN